MVLSLSSDGLSSIAPSTGKISAGRISEFCSGGFSDAAAPFAFFLLGGIWKGWVFLRARNHGRRQCWELISRSLLILRHETEMYDDGTEMNSKKDYVLH